MVAFLSSILVAVIYQFFLTVQNMSDYMMSLKRETLVDENKEGIFSTIGYLSLYLGGEAIYLRLNEIILSKSRFLFCHKKIYTLENVSNFKVSVKFFCLKRKNSPWRKPMECFANLFAIGVLSMLFCELTRNLIENTSRRLCNLSFILLVVNLFNSWLI